MTTISREGPLRMPLVRELDGIRAIAVTIVFLSHAGLGQQIPGGLGVTIFFFLSGYLITSLLYAESATRGRIDLGGFYLRRVLRIFPPLYITLALSGLLVLSGVLARPVSLRSLLSQILFFSNYDRMIGEFQGLPGPPLWSLAVEEHFYLLFPLLFGAVMLAMPARRAGFACLIACVVPLAMRLVAIRVGWDYTLSYYYTHTRADSILFGCVLALVSNPALHPETAWRPGVGAFAGACAFLVAVTLWRGEVFAETWRYTLQGLALLVIFAFAVRTNRITSPLLNSALAQLVGKFSYTLYLVHVLVIALLHAVLPVQNAILVAILAAALSMLYAWAMFIWIERPLAQVRHRLHREPAPEPMGAPNV